jgi:hypothetical protein
VVAFLLLFFLLFSRLEQDSRNLTSWLSHNKMAALVPGQMIDP